MTLTNGTGAPANGDLFSIVSGLQYQGDAGGHAIEIGTGQTVPTNVAGDRAFIAGGSRYLCKVKQLIGALRGNYRQGISDALGGLNQGVSQIAAIQGEVGATSNRLTTSAAQLEDSQRLLYTDTLRNRGRRSGQSHLRPDSPAICDRSGKQDIDQSV